VNTKPRERGYEPHKVRTVLCILLYERKKRSRSCKKRGATEGGGKKGEGNTVPRVVASSRDPAASVRASTASCSIVRARRRRRFPGCRPSYSQTASSVHPLAARRRRRMRGAPDIPHRTGHARGGSRIEVMAGHAHVHGLHPVGIVLDESISSINLFIAGNSSINLLR